MALYSCFDNSSLPPGWSKVDKSNVAKSAQSTAHCQSNCSLVHLKLTTHDHISSPGLGDKLADHGLFLRTKLLRSPCLVKSEECYEESRCIGRMRFFSGCLLTTLSSATSFTRYNPPESSCRVSTYLPRRRSAKTTATFSVLASFNHTTVKHLNFLQRGTVAA